MSLKMEVRKNYSKIVSNIYHIMSLSWLGTGISIQKNVIKHTSRLTYTDQETVKRPLLTESIKSTKAKKIPHSPATSTA